MRRSIVTLTSAVAVIVFRVSDCGSPTAAPASGGDSAPEQTDAEALFLKLGR